MESDNYLMWGSIGGESCLVPREGVEVDAEVLDVDLPVWGVCYGVNAELGSGDGMDHLGDAFDVVDRT
jgi:hypothetical protein